MGSDERGRVGALRESGTLQKSAGRKMAVFANLHLGAGDPRSPAQPPIHFLFFFFFYVIKAYFYDQSLLLFYMLCLPLMYVCIIILHQLFQPPSSLH